MGHRYWTNINRNRTGNIKCTSKSQCVQQGLNWTLDKGIRRPGLCDWRSLRKVEHLFSRTRWWAVGSDKTAFPMKEKIVWMGIFIIIYSVVCKVIIIKKIISNWFFLFIQSSICIFCFLISSPRNNVHKCNHVYTTNISTYSLCV